MSGVDDTEEAVVAALVQAGPPLAIDWRDPQYWKDGHPIGHWIVEELAVALDAIRSSGEWHSLTRLGETIERLLTDGSNWGQELAETGLLVSLSNRLSWLALDERRPAIEGFRNVLGPEGRRLWGLHADDLLVDDSAP